MAALPGSPMPRRLNSLPPLNHVFPSIEQEQEQGQQQPETESTRWPISWISYCSNCNKISLERTNDIVEQRAILLCEEENLEDQMSGSNSEQQPSGQKNSH